MPQKSGTGGPQTVVCQGCEMEKWRRRATDAGSLPRIVKVKKQIKNEAGVLKLVKQVKLGMESWGLRLDVLVITWCRKHQPSMGIYYPSSRRNRRKDRRLARIVLEHSCSLAVILRIRYRKHHRHQHQTRQVVFVSRALDLLVGLFHIIAIKTRKSKHVIIHLGVIKIMCSLDSGVVESSCIVDHRCTYLSSFGCIISVSVD